MQKQINIFIERLFIKLLSLISLIVVSGNFFAASAAVKFQDIFLFEDVSKSSGYFINPPQQFRSTLPDVEVPNCPDAGGILRGTARTQIADAKNPAITIIVEAKITAYVDDAAELTHFDLNGTVNENGAKRADFSIEESKIDSATKEADRQGRTMINVAPNLDALSSERINQAAAVAVKTIFEQIADKLRSARDAWRSGGCVEVKLTAPKNRLSAGEKVVVTAESVHKLEKNPIQAKLIKKEASASATPDEQQRGALLGSFTLTAPEVGKKAFIIVESISKRGIGSGKLEFEESSIAARKPPVKKTPPGVPPKKATAAACGAWSGKITLVKRKKTQSSKPASGAKLRDITNKDTSLNLEYALPGIQDTSQGFTNGYFADTQVSYRDAEYREEFYKAVKMGCKGGGIITTDETHNFELVSTASGGGRTTVYVTVGGGEKGILTLSVPEGVKGEQIITRKYETSCAPYNEINSGVDHNGSVEAPTPGFEIEFELDAKSNYQLTGSKTLEDSDGSEIIVSWNLTRECK